MKKPLISFLVTCKNEGLQLKLLIDTLIKYHEGNEIIIVNDFSSDETTCELLNIYRNLSNQINIKVYEHALNNNYSEHKNYGKSLCTGEYIFQIDADELPSTLLLESLTDILKLNTDVDLFWIPRINDFRGVNQQNATQWGWRLTPYEDINIVNWPDPQGRLFKNVKYMRWERRLHEKIEGAKSFSHLPSVFEYALHHHKTIEKQIETNIKYNKEFTSEENQGFKL